MLFSFRMFFYNVKGFLADDMFNLAYISRSLIKSKELREIAEIVLHHHERWDGKGYPSGLKEEQIPLGSRIIAVAYTIDAMTAIRSYRKAMSWEVCKNEVLLNKGIQFDTMVVEAAEEFWKRWELQRLLADSSTGGYALKVINERA